jgi:hypothetical protein
MENELTPKQQASEAVRQARTILVTTGARPSVDQVASVVALTQILRKFGKKTTAIISDPIPESLSFLGIETLDRSLSGQRDFILRLDLGRAEVDSLKYTIDAGKLNVHITPAKGSFAPSDVTFDYGSYHYDLAIVLGVASRTRLDRVFTENPELYAQVPMINLDFHRSNEGYGAVNLIDGNAASLGEILIALSESLQTGLIDEDISTALLTGIIASTDRFTANHTTAKSLTVAAQMMAAGARQQQIVTALYKSDSSDDRPRRDGGGSTDGGRSGGRGGNTPRDGGSRPKGGGEQPSSWDNSGRGGRSEAPKNTARPADSSAVADAIAEVNRKLAESRPAASPEPVAVPDPTPAPVMPIPDSTPVVPATTPMLDPKPVYYPEAPDASIPWTTPEVSPVSQPTLPDSTPSVYEGAFSDAPPAETTMSTEPELFFRGHGSVLANLPEVPVLTASPVLDPYLDPAVLAFSDNVQGLPARIAA